MIVKSGINPLVFENRRSKINEIRILRYRELNFRKPEEKYLLGFTNNVDFVNLVNLVKSGMNPAVFENRRSKINEIRNPLPRIEFSKTGG